MKQVLITALLLVANFAMAQNDPQYVIKSKDNGHYLAHSGSTVLDADTFNPETCLWYSSNNYNYYFMVGTTKMYLKAPLELNGTITIAQDPGTQMLNNNTHDYFFYDWDKGLARGLQLYGVDCSQYNSPGSQCWEVVWVSYEDNQWKMSSVYGYNPTTYSARFLKETTTVHSDEISNESGGVGNLSNFSMNFGQSKPLSGTADPYTYTFTPAYTHYHIDGLQQGSPHNTNIPEENYYYYNNQFNPTVPTSTPHTENPDTYAWSLSGDGAQYLSFAQNSNVTTSNIETPTLYYRTENNTETHKTATLTLTVTYEGGATQTSSATVTVKTSCKNPTVIPGNTVVTIVGVTVSWLPSATEYTVSWKKTTEATWNSVTVGDVSSYTITDLEDNTTYNYKVQATCDTNDPTTYTFTTLEETGLIVVGAIFGGGRMADVTGNTEVVIVNCDSIGAIYGGNDIAGKVEGEDGSIITLGVNTGDPYANTYGTTPNNGSVRVGSVYGGGNGYYAYNGSSFVAASDDYFEEEVAVGESVKAMTQSHQVGETVWTNTGTTANTLDFPSIVKTAIKVTNDKVKVDSIFGGAKNAFLTFDDYNDNGSSITIDGGTVLAVFGGNNWGGTQKRGKHYIEVNGTTTNLNDSIENTATSGYGRDFGIRYLFGGGNKVYGSTTNVVINGGQCDTIFAGGNSADVYAANMTVNCAMGNGSGNTWNKVYSNAIDTYSGGVITPKTDYGWDGYSGIYNVRTLFGGNNQATFDSKLNQKVPTITLTSGSIGTVYGGGNAGDMWGISNNDGHGNSLVINGDLVKYGTHVVMDSPNILIDNLYGGCQVSNVRYSTWVEVNDGHVGSVFGGCNVSGDVGSTMEDPDEPSHSAPDVPNPEYQKVFGGTYVVASGGTVYKNLFAGGNGFYHCVGPDGNYYGSINYTSHNYVGMAAPTHNETHVIVNPGATVKGNVYAGGNLASVGFNNSTVGDNPFPTFVGLASVLMSGGTVNGSVYGGGNMADVFGSNEVQVSGGTIDKSLYGGNDRMGKVAQISNRVLPDSYKTASDDATSLEDPKVYTYVGLTGNPTITNVYGGGNGDYQYCTSFDEAQSYIDGGGTKETVVSCDITNQPIQRATFVDVGIYGGANGGHLGTVYGGGDGVTVTEFLKVFLNVKTNPTGYTNVGTIFGGNNKGDLALVSDIILLQGQVGTVYGGCNQGAMTAGSNVNTPTKTIVCDNGDTYSDVGSYVRLLASYDPDGSGSATAITPNVKVMDAVYGGCRMNGVTKNSLVLVEGGNYSNTKIFGGSDIQGDVEGISHVAVNGGTVSNIYGGGNGDYDYTSGTYSSLTPPNSNSSRVNVTDGAVLTGVYGGNNAQGNIAGLVEVNVTGGTIGANGTPANIHGGGYGAATTTDGDVRVNIGATDGATNPTYSGTATIWGDVYGGSALGEVSASDKLTQVNFYKGTINGDVYGGGLGDNDHAAEVSGDVEVNIYGGVFNSATGTAGGGSIYGCNNANGTPKGDVEVNIYGTDHGNDPETNAYPSSAPEGGWNATTLAANTAIQTYAIGAVYGGGNKAAYIPAAVSSEQDPHSTTVHVYNCNNTIQNVYGGGNAADVGTSAIEADANVIIDGGRIKQVFGGGNGAGATNPGANVFGTATATLYAGLIDQAFGGSNEKGNITTTHLILGHDNTNTCDAFYSELFGGGNLAEFTGDLITDIQCGVGSFGDFYGGANKANIKGNVTLNVYGGTFNNVFGGSKGVAGGAAANIMDNPDTDDVVEGNVTLNLYGGTIGNAFGGSNQNGNITGTITVNVLDYENCALTVNNIYGSGNVTAYTPNDLTSGGKPVSPMVNVMHVKESTSTIGNVFGGALGATATVTANPQVTIGYNASMVNLIPTDYFTTVTSLNSADDFAAIVTGKVYGGGDEAPVVGSTSITIQKDNTAISQDVYGGGNEADVSGSVTVNVTGGTVTQDVYGGGALADVNVTTTGGTPALTSGATTHVSLSGGTVRNLYGGGLGRSASTPVEAKVWGPVEVSVSGGTATNVFGCNNLNGAPQSTVVVNMTGGTIDNLYGGGDQAYYEGTPTVNIQNGNINNKVFGGGNNISIDGKGVAGSNVQMSGGTVLVGLYGGCNTDGDVTGDVTITLTGGTVGTDSNPANIHGGGFGHPTRVSGDVTVNFGAITYESGNEIHTNGPVLYGDLYGGSALGNVNTNGDDYTIINVLNGQIVGNVFGGGLGDKASLGVGHSNIAALVNGKVQVNIGTAEIQNPGTTSQVVILKGMASLSNCNIFGCNNQNGSPQDSVLVNIYKTNHTATDLVSYEAIDATYAIENVFGGGNMANYEPVGYDNGYTAFTPNGGHRTCVYIHGCYNTIRNVYGGGNAADAFGVTSIIEGGRFNEVFGGGNGLVVAANIGYGGIGIKNMSGHVNYFFEGSNRLGTNAADRVYDTPLPTIGVIRDCGDTFIVDAYFCGANMAEEVDGVQRTITCDEALHYKYLYAGSRWATIYGDVNVTIEGGFFENVFGGSRGYNEIGNTVSADIKKYPTLEEVQNNPGDYSTELKDYLAAHTDLYGQGGNINLIIKGGTIGEVFGGCDILGNVEGKITVTIEDGDNTTCPLFLGNVYGASNRTFYAPTDPNIDSPEVKVLKATIGGTTTQLGTTPTPKTYAGNVFGGGNLGDVTSNPKVVIGAKDNVNPVTIEGNVYGGGNEGDVNGNARVIIVPTE